MAYNLTVDGIHTYFVQLNSLVEDGNVLVHNSCAPFVPGDIYYHSIQTKKGVVEMMAAVEVDGSTLVLGDIAVYGSGGLDRGALGMEGAAAFLRAVREELVPQAGRQGYTHVRITGTRVSGPVGHPVDKIFPVK
ncbi:hypothetical protein GCM10027436_32120 [Actinophytocola sediminis]